MTKLTDRPFNPDPEPSRGILDGYARLAAAILVAAAKDLRGRRLLKSMDALCWWLDPAGAIFWLEALDIELDLNTVFKRALGGIDDDSIIRIAKNRIGKTCTQPASAISKGADGNPARVYKGRGRPRKGQTAQPAQEAKAEPVNA
jgi:hypothetical protein